MSDAHDCETCQECIHDGNRCCGCYDGACCRDEQERQWAEHVKKARAEARCEYSGLKIHSCHRSICDCFDAWGCACMPGEASA